MEGKFHVKHVTRIAIIGLGLVALGTQGGAAETAGENCTIAAFVYGMNGPNCRPGPSPCDLNGDLCVDLADFAILQNEWAP